MVKAQKPIYIAIVGRANVGKSSIFNAMVGSREAIVSDEAGTTRDRVLAPVRYDAKHFWLIDTAGMKNPQDSFELSIQDQIAKSTKVASLIIVVVSADVPPTSEDRSVAKLAIKSNKPVILLINKVDKNRSADLAQWQKLAIKPAFFVSAIHKTGFDEVLTYVAKHVPDSAAASRPPTPRVGILGRPNVGKSSLFNSLAGKPSAVVSSQASTTRDINRLWVKHSSKEIEIMDTAGIRRPGKISPGVEKFSVTRSLNVIEQSDVCLLVMDVTELSVQMDQKIAGMIADAGKGLILVINKWDAIPQITSSTQNNVMHKIVKDFAFVPWAPVIFTSALTGQNTKKVLDLVLEINDVRQQKFTTSQLNRWLTQATNHHPPAGLKHRSPSLNYIVQETDQVLPSFKVFGKNVKSLHWSYKRYLEKSFRDKWPLAGTPLKFWFIENR